MIAHKQSPSMLLFFGRLRHMAKQATTGGGSRTRRSWVARRHRNIEMIVEHDEIVFGSTLEGRARKSARGTAAAVSNDEFSLRMFEL